MYFQVIMESFPGLKSSITRGWNRSCMFCKYRNFENFFDLHCNHWPFACVSCNVLSMDVVWSFCYIYKRQATAQRENKKIRATVLYNERERGRHFASLKCLQKSLQKYLRNQCVCHNSSITGRLKLKCMSSCQYLKVILYIRLIKVHKIDICWLIRDTQGQYYYKKLYPYHIH